MRAHLCPHSLDAPLSLDFERHIDAHPGGPQPITFDRPKEQGCGSVGVYGRWVQWTANLHERFVDAVAQLGGPDSERAHSFFLFTPPPVAFNEFKCITGGVVGRQGGRKLICEQRVRRGWPAGRTEAEQSTSSLAKVVGACRLREIRCKLAEKRAGEKSAVMRSLCWAVQQDLIQQQGENYLASERQRVLNDPKAVMPVAFVTFDSRWGAAVCAQTA
ncbi:hypothetical protein E2562_036666 [Oryza meyeriana var. granulata]|uniref:Uncharacterized protein n=1 Tax=Oryza meyeriana var. granulata TaxID=110450 RepID=A0A6G1FGI9_9ORYZ|nr:hypothetical protein E2562_036666 [Oryza meyeriana var. granulata]